MQEGNELPEKSHVIVVALLMNSHIFRSVDDVLITYLPPTDAHQLSDPRKLVAHHETWLCQRQRDDEGRGCNTGRCRASKPPSAKVVSQSKKLTPWEVGLTQLENGTCSCKDGWKEPDEKLDTRWACCVSVREVEGLNQKVNSSWVEAGPTHNKESGKPGLTCQDNRQGESVSRTFPFGKNDFGIHTGVP